MTPATPTLSVSTVDLYRDGTATVHFRAAVVDEQHFVLPIPETHLSTAFSSLSVMDNRGEQPIITLPASTPMDKMHYSALPLWLRAHVGSAVHLEQQGNTKTRRPVWSLSGVLLGVQRQVRSRESIDHEKDALYTVFMRVGTSIVARNVDSISNLLIRTVDPKDYASATIPNAADLDGMRKAFVMTKSRGEGELRISYTIQTYRKPPFEFCYETDATGLVYSNSVVETKTSASCVVQFENPLPFVLKNVTYRLMENKPAPEYIEPNAVEDNEYLASCNNRRDSSGTTESRTSTSNSQELNSDSDLEFNDDSFTYHFIPLHREDVSMKDRRSPPMVTLHDENTLQPGQRKRVVLDDVEVCMSIAQLVMDNVEKVRPILCVQNASGDWLPPAKWLIKYGENVSRPRVPALQLWKWFRLPVIKPVTIEVNHAYKTMHGKERILHMEGWNLVTRVKLERVIDFWIHTEHPRIQQVHLSLKYETNPHLRCNEKATQYSLTEDGHCIEGVGEPLPAMVNEPKGYLTYSILLHGSKSCVVAARQLFFSPYRYDLRKNISATLFRHLKEGGASPEALDQLQTIVDTRNECEDNYAKLKALKRNLKIAKNRVFNFKTDFLDDEENETIDRFEAELELAVSCICRLRIAIRGAEENLDTGRLKFRAAVEDIREKFQPESAVRLKTNVAASQNAT